MTSPFTARSLLAVAALATPVAAATAVVPTPASADYAYVVNNRGDDVGQYTVARSGKLAPSDNPDVRSDGPVDIALSPDGRSAYVPTQSKASISQYTVGADGRLVPKDPARVAAPFSLTAIAVSPDGRSAYVTGTATTSTSAGTIAQYSIAANGTLTPKSPATVATGLGPQEIALSPDGGSAYVANVYSDDVSQYTVGMGGTLIPKSPATVAAGRQPHGIAVAPDGGTAYVTNAGVSRDTSTVSQYTIGADGTVAPMRPATVPSGFHPRAIAVSPDGDSAYVANQLADTISQYTITASGRLSPKTPATVPAGTRPYAITVDPEGRSAYAANYASGDVSQYSIGNDGRMDPTDPATVPAGSGPYAIAVRDSPPSSTPELSLGKVRRNELTGAAKLRVTVGRRGRLVLSGKLIKRATKRPRRARTLNLAIVPGHRAKHRLKRTGRVKAHLEVSFTPEQGAESTKHRTVVLVMRRQR